MLACAFYWFLFNIWVKFRFVHCFLFFIYSSLFAYCLLNILLLFIRFVSFYVICFSLYTLKSFNSAVYNLIIWLDSLNIILFLHLFILVFLCFLYLSIWNLLVYPLEITSGNRFFLFIKGNLWFTQFLLSLISKPFIFVFYFFCLKWRFKWISEK